MHLSKDDLLKADDNAPEEVDLSDLPGYHGSVLIRGMTGKERDAFETSVMRLGSGGRREVDTVNFRARLVARCAIDDDGNRLLTDADAAALGDKSAAAINRMWAVATRLSGMSDEEQEELTRDFALADGDGSPSTLPPGLARRSKNSSARSAAGN
jgi:hypothetical protein